MDRQPLRGTAAPVPAEEADTPPCTTLEKWAIALRVMAVLWWIGALIVTVLDAASLSQAEAPGTMIVRAVLASLFSAALGGILLYAFSYVLVGIDCLVENTAITAEAVLAGEEPHDKQHPVQPDA